MAGNDFNVVVGAAPFAGLVRIGLDVSSQFTVLASPIPKRTFQIICIFYP